MVKGSYVLSKQEPWNELKDVFSKTYFIDKNDDEIMDELVERVGDYDQHTVTGFPIMDILSSTDAEDLKEYLDNAQSICENIDFQNHEILNIRTQQMKENHANDFVQEFTHIVERAFQLEGNELPKPNHLVQHLGAAFNSIDQRINSDIGKHFYALRD